MTYCTTCGIPRGSSSRFCTGCGKPLSAAPPEHGTSWPLAPAPSQGDDDDWGAGTPTRRRRRGRLVAAAAALALLLGSGVTAWATLTHDNDTPALPSASTSPQPNPPQTASTSQTAGPTSSVDPEDAALDQLTQLISRDQPQVRSQLDEAWVPQLSSKQHGLEADGMTYNYTDILDDHRDWRSTYSARLVWSGDWSSFEDDDFYVTVATVSFSTPEEANAWCDAQAIDADNCFARRLSTIARPGDSTVHR